MPSLSKEQLAERLRPFGQEHLLRFWDDLSTNEQASFARQIEGIDFAQVAKLVQQAGTASQPAAPTIMRPAAHRAEPPPAIRLSEQRAGAEFEKAQQHSAQALHEGKLGVVLVAGGQGTRLGFDHPKGLFPVGPISKAPLFQILFEKLLAARKRYGAAIPLYIMTSPATHEDTVAALDKCAAASAYRPRTSWFSARERCRPSNAEDGPVALGGAWEPVPQSRRSRRDVACIRSQRCIGRHPGQRDRAVVLHADRRSAGRGL